MVELRHRSHPDSQINRPSSQNQVYQRIADTVSSGYVLTNVNIEACLIEYGYSPKSASNFAEFIRLGKFARLTGVELGRAKIGKIVVYFDLSIPSEDTDIDRVRAELASHRKIVSTPQALKYHQ